MPLAVAAPASNAAMVGVGGQVALVRAVAAAP